jgi:YebC/PmpR family DNA-binding regulatory protein
MSGHNKWSSIKHRKGAQDAKRGVLFSKLIREITVSVREGGADEEMNSSLRTVLEKARDANMPKDTIERAIARGAGESGGQAFERVTFEGYAASGVAVIVETLTDNRNRTVSDVRHAFTRCGGNLGENGCVSWMFERKGRLEIPVQGINDDAMMEHVLESSAEDFAVEGDSYIVTCATEDFAAVRNYFKNKNMNPHNADLVLIPKSSIAITDEKTANQVFRLLDMLDDLDDVQKTSSNFEIDDALMAKMEA